MSEFKVGNEFLPYHPSASHPSPDYRNGWNACFSEAEIQITKLQAEVEALRKDAKWIPVSERLPKDGDSVFVFSKYGHSDMADFISGAFENCWLIDDAEDTITHWVGKPSKPPAIKGEQA